MTSDIVPFLPFLDLSKDMVSTDDPTRARLCHEVRPQCLCVCLT